VEKDDITQSRSLAPRRPRTGPHRGRPGFGEHTERAERDQMHPSEVAL